MSLSLESRSTSECVAMFVSRAAFHPQTPRIVLAVLASSSTVLGAGMIGQAVLPWRLAWVWLFLCSGVSCTWAAVRFGRERPLAIAGASTITAHFIRGLLIPVGKLLDAESFTRFSWWDVAVSITLWWTVAFVVAVLFFRRLEPIASIRRHGG